jgi:flagellar export protein FliJ
MKTFQFTLEAVRIVRQRNEQDAMERYAHALLARRQATDRLETVQREIDAGWQELRALLARGCAASLAAQAHVYQQSLEKRRNECAAELGLAERRVNLALQAMLHARQQREIVDKCFEKQKARHQREHLRAEQKFIDDLAGRRGSSILSWNPTGALS